MAEEIGGPEPGRFGGDTDTKRSFFALNAEISVIAAYPSQAENYAPVQRLFDEFEERFSRFRADSELSRLNRRAGAGAVSVSVEMLALLQECQHFWRVTDGIFNPFILLRLEASGYERSFEQIDRARSSAEAALPVPRFEIGLDPSRLAVSLPEATGLDFGGIGKGYAVDRAAEMLGPGHYLIDAGGDIFVRGFNRESRPWRLGVADPRQPDRDLTTIALRDKAVATSGTLKRRWPAGDGWANHLIDPRSGEPVANGIIGVTVVADSASAADVFAKTALILGHQAGLAFLERQTVQGLFVREDGAQFGTSGWSSLLA